MIRQNKANPHTVKKFELVEGYVKSWIQKLMNFSQCKKIVFIDCMCNNGIYTDNNGNRVEGTPIRVAKVMAEAMKNYPDKTATLYLNNKDADKISTLKNLFPGKTNNFQFHLSHKDGNDLLKELKLTLLKEQGMHYLLFYDPFKAVINREALAPYFFGWGEVIFNHMIFDPLRALKQSIRLETKRKYDKTYLTPFEELLTSVGDRKDYERRVINIIDDFCQNLNRKYYVVTVPFFIKTNSLIYDLIVFTKNIEGFKLFKSMA